MLPITTDIGEQWGRMSSHNPLAVVDGLMAATAIVHDLTLATRNTADVASAGARLFNPFEG